MEKDKLKDETANGAKPVLADGLSANNPFRKIIGWYVGGIERHMKFHEIPYTNEDLREFRANYSDCNNCQQWYKDTDFSSFVLGVVLCKRCDV
jgi:hypothetical protein